ncbi:phosphatidylglycerol/phosphatidylinositol transfer protein [Anaeramoeba ignava]|uniref:Phosphatidylglycerol/phosphatidylinositol transfer protein n=1 Tax=Anaeramoeba ignava TaxID=1746090 RepID=A0A9Q0LEJ3_ANAIG|nr:phosphatidylglycerol/phosphatidylinositol transfer protein [Anaeramoeba ignava]|eukprot:Anaeramoba_ignava/a478200_4293.p1 GENE.a478200_4293~~a478200_4293.p1  ORF type:complete len:139 (+),score=34.22 a478200_4293:173-589(+)
MKVILFFLLIVAAFADIWTDCSQAGDDFKITDVVITPNPPVKGQPMTAEIKGALSKTITGGTAELMVYYNGIKLLDITKDICTIDPDLPCPINANPSVDLKFTETIPSYVPSGKYTGQAVMKDQDGKEIVCVKFDLNL